MPVSEVREVNAVQGSIDELIDGLNRWRSRQVTIGMATKTVADIAGVGFCGLSLLDGGEAAIHYRVKNGEVEHRRFPAGTNPAAVIARLSEPMRFELDDAQTNGLVDPSAWDSLRNMLIDGGLVEMMLLPLVSSSGQHGALFVATHEAGRFDDLFVEQLTAVAAIITMALERDDRVNEATNRLKRIEALHTQLSSSNRQLAEFAHIASSDLQDPLRKILTHSENLQHEATGELTEREADYLGRINAAAHRMQRLLNDLLQLSSVQTANDPHEPVMLESVLTDVLSDLEVAIEEANASVAVESLPTVLGNPTQLRQLFQNLVGNAIKFRRPDTAPVITVYSAPSGHGSVRIEVADNGIGFDQRFADRIFKPFQRLHSEAEYSGSGIGLAVCRRIAQGHGGQLQARSHHDCGSTFTVQLLLAEDHA